MAMRDKRSTWMCWMCLGTGFKMLFNRFGDSFPVRVPCTNPHHRHKRKP